MSEPSLAAVADGPEPMRRLVIRQKKMLLQLPLM